MGQALGTLPHLLTVVNPIGEIACRDVADRLQLVGTAEIADMLGVSRQRAHVIAQRDDFPEPTARLSAGLIWQRRDVERWIADHRDAVD